MSNPNAPAISLLADAILHLAAHGIDVTIDRVDGRLCLCVDGEVISEGELIAKAQRLGMLKSGSLQ